MEKAVMSSKSVIDTNNAAKTFVSGVVCCVRLQPRQQQTHRSIRRRIAAIMRMAFRILGMGEKRGLGSLGRGAAVAAALAAMGIASLGTIARAVMGHTDAPLCPHCGRSIEFISAAQRQFAQVRASVGQFSSRGALAAAIFAALAAGTTPAMAQYAAGGGSTTTDRAIAIGGTGGVAPTATGVASIALGAGSSAVADRDIAIGNQAIANGGANGLSLAVGASAKTTGTQGSAFGVNTQAGEFGTAIGAGAIANAQFGTALGANATVTGGNGTALGVGSLSEGNNSFAGGQGSKAFAQGGVAIGGSSTAGVSGAAGIRDVAIGAVSQATGGSSVAIGDAAVASASASIAQGAGASATADRDIAIGSKATANGGALGLSIAIGASAKTTGTQGVALGVTSQAGEFGTAIGPSAAAIGQLSTAVGANATANSNNSFAGGWAAQTFSQGGVALGVSSVAGVSGGAGIRDVAIGAVSQATGGSSIAIGDTAAASASNSIAQGTGAIADSAGAVAIGQTAKATGGKAVSIGVGNTATGDGAVAIGDPNVATGTGAVAMGANNTSNGQGAVALGNSNIATGQGSVALGNTSTASAAGAVALGDTAVANNANDVALGSGSVTAAPNTGTTVLFGGTAAGIANPASGVVSVGSAGAERQLQNVAAGVISSTSTDAINGSQLNSVVTGVNNVGSSVANTFGGTTTYDPATGTVTGGFSYGGNTYNSVQNTINAITGGSTTAGVKYFHANSTGPDSSATGTDAVAVGVNSVASSTESIAMGANAQAANQFSTAIGPSAAATGDFATALGSNSAATGASSTAIGVNAKASAANGTALGSGATATNADDVALGSGSVTAAAVPTTGDTINGNAYTYAGTAPTSTVSVGAVGAERTITNVAAGRVSASSTDAINGSQLFATNTEVGKIGTTVNNITNGKVGAFVSDNTVTSTQPVSSGANSLAGGFGSSATGPASSVIGNGATDNGVANSTVLGQGASITAGLTGSNAAIGQGSAVTAAAVPVSGTTLQGTAYTFAGATPAGVVSFGTAGAERQLTNVAAGQLSATSTDAVNGSQLFATNTALNTIVGGGGVKYFHANSTLPDSSATGSDSVAVGPNAVSAGTDAIAMGANSQATNQFSTAVGPSAAATGDFGTALGSNATVTGTNGTALGVGALSEGNNSFAGGQGSKAFAQGGVAIGGSSIAGVSGGAGVRDIAIGGQSQAIGGSSVAIGDAATASAANTIAMGKNATATNANDVALGSGSVTAAANPTASTAINGTTYTFAGTTPTSVVSVGAPGAERQITNVAAGQLSGTSTDAINGSQLFASNTAITQVGTTVNNLGAKISNTFGGGSTYDPVTNTFTGPTYTTYNNNGTSTSVTNLGDVINNINSQGIKYFHANSTLPDSVATGTDSVAIGPNAVANNANDVALGSGSVTAAANPTASTVLQGTTYNFAGATPTSVVSVGAVGAERQITNVAAGQLSATSTDAINGSQLYATNTALNNITNGKAGPFVSDNTVTSTQPVSSGANSLAGGFGSSATGAASSVIGNGATDNGVANSTVLGQGASITAGLTGSNAAIGQGSTVTAAAVPTAGATIGGTAYTFAGATPAGVVSFGTAGAERQLTNVAAGQLSATSTDAVNGSQLFATNSQVTSNSTTINTIINGGGIKYFHSTSTLADSQAIGTDSVAIGPNAVANNANDVALGSGSVTAAAIGTPSTVIRGTTYAFAGATPLGTVSVGAVGAERTITNVAAGRILADSTDAINGSQLFATNTAVNNIINGGGVKYFHANSTDPDSVASGANAVAIGPSAVASGASSVALGDGANASLDGSVALGSGSATDAPVVGTASTKIAGTTYGFAGTAPVGTVSVGSKGKERTITNVAAGQLAADSTDAVNGSQLFATNSAVETLNSTVININNGGGIKYFHSNSTLADSVAGGTNSVAVGPASVASAANSVAVGNGANASTANSVALGAGSTTAAAVATTGTTIAGKDYAFAGGAPVGVVSVGAVGAERQITNVAAGQLNASSTDAVNGSQLFATNTAVNNVQSTVNNFGAKIENVVQYDVVDGKRTNSVTLIGGDTNAPVVIHNVGPGVANTDAVNVSQLKQTSSTTLNQANSYTDNRTAAAIQTANNYTDNKFNQLNSKLGNIQSEARQAAAIGLAAASLRYDDRPGKLSAAIGGGVWKGEGAFAFGVGYTSEDARLRTNLSGTVAGGSVGVGAGLSYTFN